MKIRSAYEKRERSGFATSGDSLTQQNFKKETDIKSIIKKHDRTGIIQHVARGVAQYGDFSEVNEYRESLDMVRAANESFMQLPSDIRAKFDNDPGEFFEFCTDPKNADEMVQLGLREAPPSPELPSAVPVKEEATKEEKDDE